MSVARKLGWLACLAVAVACGGRSRETLYVASEGHGADGSGAATGGSAADASGGGGRAAGGSAATAQGGSHSGGSGGSAGDFAYGGRTVHADKVDLLFMIDNSISMSDKQEMLAEAVPVLVSRLITPNCVNTRQEVVGVANPTCASGAPEFAPIRDLHVGVITSSLGDHGSGDVCSLASAQEDNTYDDGAELLPSMRPAAFPALRSWNDQGFLVWDPRAADESPHAPPGWGSALAGSPGGAADFVLAFKDQVTAAGEHGCGYEASLESWYRFLVDPEPVSGMTNDGAVSRRGPPNAVVLAQRAAFLRPDSLLAILMLSDENDCSILDEDATLGWLVPFKGGPQVNSWRMPRAHAVCSTDPNADDCLPCVPGDRDVACRLDGDTLDITDDPPNLRCFRQRERFGIDLLYPVERYVAALANRYVDPRLDGRLVENPLFLAAPGQAPRDPSLIFLAGIIGVPWQDIATDESLDQPEKLEFLTADELAARGRWDMILGDPVSNIPPSDPLMVESIDPRPLGAPHPLVADAAIAAPDSPAGANSINGHEQAVVANDRSDLQFSCIFPLRTPVVCTDMNDGACDCHSYEYKKQSPLCRYDQPDADGVQERAKAYPGLRELEVLKGVGSNAIVASICPKNIRALGSTTSDPNYGYNPATAAIVESLKDAVTAGNL